MRRIEFSPLLKSPKTLLHASLPQLQSTGHCSKTRREEQQQPEKEETGPALLSEATTMTTLHHLNLLPHAAATTPSARRRRSSPRTGPACSARPWPPSGRTPDGSTASPG